MVRIALGTPVAVHDAGTHLGDAALGGDDDALGIGMQRLGDQRLVEAGAVGMGGVDQRHAESTARRRTRIPPAGSP